MSALHKNSKILSEKQPKAKRAGGVIQVIAFLCSKHKVLSSHTSTAKELIFKFV
jgi:hypothetical protein